jgi:hypothetical protein
VPGLWLSLYPLPASCAHPFRNGWEIPGNSVFSGSGARDRVGLAPTRAAPEEHVRLVAVVRATAELDVRDGRSTADRVGHDVVVLQEGALAAAMPARTDERTAASVAAPDDAPDLGRDVSGIRDDRTGRGGDRTRLHWPAHDRHLAARVRVDELRQRAIEDRRDVTARDRVPEEVLRHLQLVALGREGWRMRTDGFGPGTRVGDGVRSGTFRTDDGVSGFGKRRAISSSTSRLLRRDAAASSSRWFSAVR